MSAQSISVGMIGLGKMGVPMTRNLLKGGFAVYVHSRSPQPVRTLTGEGATDAGSPAGVAKQCDVIVTSLPDPDAVREVYLADDGLVSNARSGQVYVDTSTVDPDLSRELSEKMQAKDAFFLDAPVSGGVAGAEAGSLTIMIGGTEEGLEKARPVLEVLGERIHLVGPSGAGTIVKLANQLLVGINMAGVAEALVMGVKAGADPDRMLEVLATSFGSSRMLERGVPLIVERNFGGGTPVDLIRKDLGLISDLADTIGTPLSIGNVARKIFDQAHDSDHGQEDMTAIVIPLEESAGVRVKRHGDV